VINGRNALRYGRDPRASLARIFLKAADQSATDVEVDFIRFLSKRSRYLAAENGVRYETLGGELRRTLYMLPDQALEWDLEVPQSAPILEFGNPAQTDPRATWSICSWTRIPWSTCEGSATSTERAAEHHRLEACKLRSRSRPQAIRFGSAVARRERGGQGRLLTAFLRRSSPLCHPDRPEIDRRRPTSDAVRRTLSACHAQWMR
jgi:hypothetical protein